MKTKPQKCKITVQLWVPLLEKLNEMATSACLNRDAYLDIVFANEASMLVEDLKGRRNSDEARLFVKRCLLELKDLRPVSLTLSRETAAAINEACDQVNVWRDVFVNRVIYLLVARSSVLEDAWDFEFKTHRDAIFDEGFEIKGLLLGPRLAAIRSFINDDPFLGLRTAIRSAYPDTGGAIHTLPLGYPLGSAPKDRGLTGLNTYLEDSLVPGTPEEEEQTKWVSELLESLTDEGANGKKEKSK